MKLSLSLKTLFRSPVRTILTFILLGLVSFAFFMRVGEYAVIRREFNNAAKQYHGVGAAEVEPYSMEAIAATPYYINADPRITQTYFDKEFLDPELLRYRSITNEQIATISEVPYISLVDKRFMTAGVSSNFLRLDEGANFYNYTARCIVEATLEEVQYTESPDPGRIITLGSDNIILLDNCKILAGNTRLIDDNGSLTVNARSSTPDWWGGFTYSLAGRSITVYSQDYIYDSDYLRTLIPGHRYVFVLRFEPLLSAQVQQSFINFQLSDYLVTPWCGAIQSVDDAPANYLELEEYSSLRELIEITNNDTHTFDVVYTDDMNSIMRFSESDMAIFEGRALTRDDSENGALVCVISRMLANEYGLGIGDSITLKLGTELFKQFKGIGAVAVTPERYKPPVEEVTLEIAGIYIDTDGLSTKQSEKPYWCYSVNTVFVPKSLLPVDENTLTDHEFSPAEVSIEVGNAWEIPAFLEEAEPLFEKLGLRLIFNDNGWRAIADEFHIAEIASIINISVFTTAILMATGFTVYLFIARKKKEYAIMRALGVPKKESARSLIIPLMSVAIVSILAGSGAAWYYLVKTIEQNNSLLVLQDYAVTTSIPTAVILGCSLGELLLTLLFTIAMIRRVGSAAPLALLQGEAQPMTERGTEIRNQGLGNGSIGIKTLGKTTTINDKQTITSHSSLQTPHSPSVLFVLRYIGKHVRRAAWKSVLALLLAALMFCTISQLVLMMRSYDDLFRNTAITARVAGRLTLSTAARIAASEYVKNPYYEAKGIVEANYRAINFVFTTDIARYTGEEADITYAEGYDETCMNSLGNIIIAGKSFLEEQGLELGDEVMITRNDFFSEMKDKYISQYISENPDSDMTEEEILESYSFQIMVEYNKVSTVFTIAGVVSTPSGNYDGMVFSPGVREPGRIAMPFYVDIAEYTVADNEYINEFREECKRIMGGSETDNLLVMNASKIENIGNMRRLPEALYPMAVAAALLIGAFLCCLTILQSSREAAIMRVLGATRLKTRTILSLEQIMLSIVGLAIGVCVMLILRRQEFHVVLGDLAVFASLYAAIIIASAAICSTLATSRSPLELLQTKE